MLKHYLFIYVSHCRLVPLFEYLKIDDRKKVCFLLLMSVFGRVHAFWSISISFTLHLVKICRVVLITKMIFAYNAAALKDLFSHYVEAWKSWYTEISGKKTVQQIS